MVLDILIVDDDRQLAGACARQLEQAGYSCRQAYDGRAALAAAKQSAPALVLLDLLLPKPDGRAVLLELRKQPATAQTPVLIMSGVFKDARTQAECESAGARGFLEKPFEMATLLNEVQALIGRAPAPSARTEVRVPLVDVPVSEYLWRTMRGGFSGAVHFERGKLHKVLLLEHGTPTAIRSNVMRETLGERLLQAGHITAPQHEAALRRAKQEQRLEGEILLEMGVLSAQAIERCVEEQVEEKLLETFRWNDGEAWEQPGVDRVSYASPIRGWSPEEVILCGSPQLRVDRVNLILSTFREYFPVVVRTALPERAMRSAPLQAALAAAARAPSVAALLADHAAPLYGLWLTGAIHFTAEAPEPPTPITPRTPTPRPRPAAAQAAAAPAAASRPAAPAAAAAAGRAADAAAAARPAAARPAAAPPPAPPAAASGPDESLAAVLQTWREQTLYDVLRVGETSTREEVQAAYLELARQYHPDRFSRRDDATRECANQIFALLSTARDTLIDPTSRGEYTRKLRGENPKAERAEVQRILRAEKLCKDGEALLKKRDMAGALACFREAVELDPSEGDFHALFAWARFLNQRAKGDEKADATALEELQKATALAPESPKGYYYQGLLHKACGRPDMAAKLFAKVLHLDPEHSEALSEKRLLKMRKEKDPKPSGGGLFGFGRKKS